MNISNNLHEKNATRVTGVSLEDELLETRFGFEIFWAIFRRGFFAMLAYCARGMKSIFIAEDPLPGPCNFNPAELPYDVRVLEQIHIIRNHGGKVALVTRGHAAAARCIADHLGCFDTVMDTTALLFAERKNELPEIALSGTRNAGIRKPVLTGKSEGRKPVDIVSAAAKAMRPHQWMKNFLVFVPLLASHNFSVPVFLQTFETFLSFCLVASSVYCLNDLLDLPNDRQHIRKKNRPIASGALPIEYATFVMPLLLISGLFLAWMTEQKLLLVLSGYFLISTAYSIALKKQVFVDIFVLAGLYTARIVAGSVSTGIPMTLWLIVFSGFFFFSLAAMKRYAELVDLMGSGRKQSGGRGYVAGDLPIVGTMSMSAGYISVLVLGLYVNSPSVTLLYHTPPVLWGVCVTVFFWLNRMMMITHRGGMHDDPIVFAVGDKASLACCGLIVGFTTLGAVL